jgi:hypothetical protein
MITQSRPVRFQPVNVVLESADKGPVGNNLAGRFIPSILAFYLLPVLMIVLMVGGMGMLVLALGRLIAGPDHRTAS